MGADMDGLDSLIQTTEEIEQRWNGRVVYITGTHVEYAPVIEFGSDPHTIESKGDDPMTFRVGGQWVSAHVVEHPGTRPYPFMRPAAESAKRNLKSIAADADSLDEFAKDVALHVEKVAKETLTANGNIESGNLKASVRAIKVS